MSSEQEVSNRPQIIVVVARQRSGTTALAETLSAGSSVQTFGEVFHHMQKDAGEAAGHALRIHKEAGYFNFKVGLLQKEPELAYPTVENQIRLFDAFIDYLAPQTDKRWILLDVKYNSWHHFEHYYAGLGHAPFLLHLLKQRNAAFIHMTRSGAFARYCSEQIAISRGKWHAERGSVTEAASITIDPAAALSDMVETRRQIETFSRFLSSIPRRIELRYEETYGAEHLRAATDMKLTRLLDGDWTSGGQVPLQKVTPPLASVVKNHDEVLAYFEPTTFWPEVSAALATE